MSSSISAGDDARAIRASIAAWWRRVQPRPPGQQFPSPPARPDGRTPQRFGDSYRWPDGTWTHSG